ncbi:transcription factor E2F8-like isoform X2 [Oscarella lobularis]|uniref:transcription factor E2F8-like isoform X2 n=1 Tax=Oscarella lobularis TaxID=121494 RepID=UPI003313D504
MTERPRRQTKRPLAMANFYTTESVEKSVRETSKNDSTPLKRFPEAWMNESTPPTSPKRLKENETRDEGVATAPKTTATTETASSLDEPVTPMANLKLLLTAISPALRDREETRRRNLSKEFVAAAAVAEDEEEEDEENEEDEEDAPQGKSKKASMGQYSRKDKSLAKLCSKFLERYDQSETTGKRIFLDEVGKRLGVERRRIYDIINVLESLEMTKRVAKNQYVWYGRSQLPATLSKLKAHARQKGLQLPKMDLQKKEMATMEKLRESIQKLQNKADDPNEDKQDKRVKSLYERRDRSLGCLTQRFLMLFFVSDTKVVGLDVAALILIGNMSPESSKWKTKVRRLYDIANILSSLGLIKKVRLPLRYGMKPAYQWVGFDLDNASQHYMATEKHSFPTNNASETKDSAGSRRSTYTKKHTLLDNFEAIPLSRMFLVVEARRLQLALLCFSFLVNSDSSPPPSKGLPLSKSVTPSQLQTAAALMQLKSSAPPPPPPPPAPPPPVIPTPKAKPAILIPMQTSILPSGQLLIPIQNAQQLDKAAFDAKAIARGGGGGPTAPLVVSLLPTSTTTPSGIPLLQLSVHRPPPLPLPPPLAASAVVNAPRTPPPAVVTKEQMESIRHLMYTKKQSKDTESGEKEKVNTKASERYSPEYGKSVQAPLRFHHYTPPNGKTSRDSLTSYLSPDSMKLRCQEELSPSTPTRGCPVNRRRSIHQVNVSTTTTTTTTTTSDEGKSVDKGLLGFQWDHAPLCTGSNF